jgi:hypothetical protein
VEVGSEGERGRTATVCSQVYDSMAIHANGDIVCWCVDVLGKRVYGNVHRDRIADVFNGPLYQETRNWLVNSEPGQFCKALCQSCGLKNVPVSEEHFGEVYHVKTLRLETTTYCNLKCPACPVTTAFSEAPTRHHQMLSLDTMLDIVSQLPHLQIIEYFDYGEPFLNKSTIEFFRQVRSSRPDIFMSTNTNGTVLTPAQIDAIASEGLAARVVFSIDGATPESYRKYRIGGSFEKAFGKMRALTEACRSAGTWRQYHAAHGGVQVVWQYILFEWNDSEKEIALAQELAQDVGVPLEWILTASEGASTRITQRSKVAAALFDPPRSYINIAVNQGLDEAVNQGLDKVREIVEPLRPPSTFGSKLRTTTDLIARGKFRELARRTGEYARANLSG